MILISLISILMLVTHQSLAVIDRTTFGRKDQVIELDDWNYMNVFEAVDFILAIFYEQNNQGKMALEEFMKAKTILIDESEDLDFGMMDLSQYHKIRTDQPLGVTPKVRIYKKNKFIDYHGEITTENLVNWAHLTMNVPLEIKYKAQFDELLKFRSVILGIFPEKNEEYKTFIKASEYYVYDSKLVIPRFAVISNTRLARDFRMVPGSVAIFKHFEDGKKVLYKGDMKNYEKLDAFLQAESIPYAHKHNFDSVHEKIHNLRFRYKHVLFMQPNDPNFEKVFESFKDAARLYSVKNDEVVFVYANPAKVPPETLKLNFDVDPLRDIPCLRITNRCRFNGKYKQARQDFSYNGIIRFTDDVIGGKVQKSIRSEVLPSDWNKNDVKYLVGSNYESFIYTNKHKSILTFYYKNDKESKEILPEFEAAAKSLKDDSSVVFAKLDVEQNDGELGSNLKVPKIILHLPGGIRSKLYNSPDFSSKAFKNFVISAGTSTAPDGYEKMMEELERDRARSKAKLEEEFIKADKEREKKWEKDVKEALEKSLVKIIGQTIDEMDEHIKYEREHANNPLEHDPQEHVESVLGHYEL